MSGLGSRRKSSNSVKFNVQSPEPRRVSDYSAGPRRTTLQSIPERKVHFCPDPLTAGVTFKT